MASIKLHLVSIWLPNYIVKRLLKIISSKTNDALFSILEELAPDELQKVSTRIKPPSGSIEEFRATMASNHNILLNELINSIGQEKAVEVSRETLYNVGKLLGEETRYNLGLDESLEDLVMAAKLLYKVLGISFTLEREEDGTQYIEIHRCTLSKRYSELTCTVLSAVDEGVVGGLNPQAKMWFERRITSGFSTCIARVIIS